MINSYKFHGQLPIFGADFGGDLNNDFRLSSPKSQMSCQCTKNHHNHGGTANHQEYSRISHGHWGFPQWFGVQVAPHASPPLGP